MEERRGHALFVFGLVEKIILKTGRNCFVLYFIPMTCGAKMTIKLKKVYIFLIAVRSRK